jgi:Mrp family chromosome partitioning ATPase
MDRSASSVRDWLRLIARRWKVGTIGSGAAFVVLAAGQYFMGARYTAQTAFDASRQRPPAPVLAKAIDKPASGQLVSPEEILALFNEPETARRAHLILTEQPTTQAVAQELDEEHVASQLEIERRPDGIFEIRASARSERTATALARAAASALERRINEQIQRKIGEALDALKQQHEVLSGQVRAKREELGRAAAETGLQATDAGVEEALARLDAQKADALARKELNEKTRDRLTRALQEADRNPAALAEAAPPDPRIADTLARRRAAVEERERLRITLEDEHPRVRQVLDHIKALDAELVQVRRAVCQEAVQAAQKAIERAVQDNTDAIQTYGKVAAARTRLAPLFRDARGLEEQARILAVTIGELDLERALTADARYAAGPIHAETVHRWANRLAAIVAAALLLGICAAYLRESLDEAIRDPLHVSMYAKLDVLATIPTITEEDIALADVERPTGHAEIYARLATLLGRRMEHLAARVLSVTSASAGEGKSTVASNLAVALARLGKRTVIVDADLRNPRQHDYFRVENRSGLSSLLERKESARAFLDTLESEAGEAAPAEDLMMGDLRALAAVGAAGEPPVFEPPPAASLQLPEAEIARVIVETEVENLKVLPAGPGPTNTGGLLESPWFDSLLSYLKNQFAYVLIDTPPVKGCADAMIVGKKAEATLLVVRAGRARREDVRGTRRYLADSGSSILGAVLNFNGDLEVAYSAWEAAA